MRWDKHLELKGKHAILNPSNYSWINYDLNDQEAFFSRYKSSYAQTIGTALHEIAASHINEKFKLSNSVKDKKHILYLLTSRYCQYKIPKNVIFIDDYWQTLMDYVNDGIGFEMHTEQILYYSDNCFGSADAISYDERKSKLRIHDLKTGVIPAHFEQLLAYASLFCLENKIKPRDIDIELRIYQNGEIFINTPTVEDLTPVMDHIITGVNYISEFKNIED